ncbi:MAG: hypothetical protein UU51_C0010G0001 [Microgenomates group bacterium GW2011_GWC1_41_20]|uniref:Uncharacterized protein n=5 Tax=Candidatus Woeseibacteriota TaxID=1752722 RepID=A0A0G0RU49_9BACT|nr:MAG: hypothetical protein UT76_C0003G0015 [Candidatus Woesebacteria bacterium GW2011_GWB1_40_12]KKR56063.1 MAG: hypothetical protein UT93_C0006G0014 [Candidatus Woesebacteria bacterium GW2011_GWF1_40_24]KKR90826.1 MAG: hypothetical protein UU39_C0007G0002 [Candidatus Woesebacteria bacterium GW2011_GWD1_41_12]KKS00342.1 MAG: hypothetical protein UU51_C0010G0001 [Microgenomates group bacterium GW2011_GWC1_41_20]OGM81243.1 MAG: hypothetical protein A2393_03210 [Candidatus Woesebacteria bacteriu
MSSLTNISITSRKIIRYGIFLILFLMVGRIFLDTGIKIYKKLFPSPPPAPTVKYGRLSAIPFPENGITAKPTYTLETAEGDLPTNISTQAKVFFMPKTNANLLSLDTAKSKAAALGYSADIQQISDTIYKFKNPNFPTYLQINIVTGTFSVSYDLVTDSSPIDFRPPVAEVAASGYKSFLMEAGLLPDDLTGSVTHDFLKISDGQLKSAMSLSEANFVKVNLFRKNYDEIPAVTGNPNQANVWAIVSGARSDGQEIIASEYHYRSVDESQYSTYPIKTPAEAFTELQSGQAFIASYGLNEDGSNIKIRNVYLAYFDPDTITEYYQPIYVFEGDNGFTAYLPAITADYYPTNTQQ